MIHFGDIQACKQLHDEFNKATNRQGVSFEQYILYMNWQKLTEIDDRLVELEKLVASQSNEE